MWTTLTLWHLTVRQIRIEWLTTSPLKNIIKISNEKLLIMFIKHLSQVYKLNYHEQILYVTAYKQL